MNTIKITLVDDLQDEHYLASTSSSQERKRNVASRRFWGLATVVLAFFPCRASAQTEPDTDATYHQVLGEISVRLEHLVDTISGMQQSPTWIDSHSFWLSPLAILLSATASWFLARNTIRETRLTAQRQATFTYLSSIRWNEEYIKSYAFYQQAKKQTVKVGDGDVSRPKIDQIAHLYREMYEDSGLDRDDSGALTIISEFNSLRRILNEYEAIASGVRNHTLNYDVIKSEIDQAYCKTVNDCKEYIAISRDIAGRLMDYDNSEKLYEHLDWLMQKLENDREQEQQARNERDELTVS